MQDLKDLLVIHARPGMKFGQAGKLATLGRGVIQRKARDILNAFAANLDQLVTGQAGTAVV